MPATTTAARGYAREAVEVETYARGFARRRPDIDVSVLRMANTIGPTIDTALAPVPRDARSSPPRSGYDPRLQLLHEDDAVGALVHAALGRRRPGSSTWPARASCRCRRRCAGPAGCACRFRRRPSPSSARWCATPASSTCRPRRRASSTTAGSSTRRGCAPSSATSPRYTTAEALHAYLDARPSIGRPVVSVLGRRAARAGRRVLRSRADGRHADRDGVVVPLRPRPGPATGAPGRSSPDDEAAVYAVHRCGNARNHPTTRAGPRRRAGSSVPPMRWPSLRKRLTGAYEVDEYGFDPDLTEAARAAGVPGAVREVVPRRGQRARARPGHRWRAARRQPLRRAVGRGTPR